MMAKLTSRRYRWDSAARTHKPVKQAFVPLAKMCKEGTVSDPNLPHLVREKVCHVLRSDGWILRKGTSYWDDGMVSQGTYKKWKQIKKEIDPHEYVTKFKQLRLEKGWTEDTRGL